MRSRISFFNYEMFRKGMARWWPLWAAWFTVWALVLPVRLLSMGQREYAWSGVSYGQDFVLNTAIYGGVIGGAIMAALAAMAVWSFLYNSRSAYGMACLPVRREGQFLSALAAGFVPVLLGNALIAALTLAAEASLGAAYPGAALTWFGVVTLVYLFFYAFASLCAQLTGNIIVLPLVYAVLNFVVYVVVTLTRYLLDQFMFGVSVYFVGGATLWLTPVLNYLMGYTNLAVQAIVSDVPDGQAVTGYAFYGWSTVLIYAAVGLVMIAGALLLFRRRKMETAGDVVAVKTLKPVFRWCMALGCALVFSVAMYEIFFNSGSNFDSLTAKFLLLLVLMLLGAFVGWFASEMLIQKSFRVFHWKSWAGCGVCGVVIVALMLGMRLDLFGYERRVPRAEQVADASVTLNGEAAYLRNPENIAALIDVHQSIIAHKDLHQTRHWDSSSYQVTVAYSLKNGGYLYRQYLLEEAEAGIGDLRAVEGLLNLPEAVQHRKETSFPLTRDNIIYCEVSAVMTATELAEALDYDSAEEFLLMAYSGWGGEYRELSPRERKMLVNDVALQMAANRYELWEKYGLNNREWETDKLDLDLSEVYLSYDFGFSPSEAADLYQNACVPDIEDGTLGRVSVLYHDERYETQFYNVKITIEARAYEDAPPNGGATVSGMNYDTARFRTTPTVDSYRTNAWLADHGIVLHTVGETQ